MSTIIIVLYGLYKNQKLAYASLELKVIKI